ncbi:heavy-metal-associated domain-containing protein [Lachnoanaerobaculum umeaense]|uniref:Heavy-metal-associated domain-containing protein n=1 Tax=Lachnoanaerobaculum umeaense TaxID=617123 RepID=A0A385Q2F0_9FIRM|nr:heavy metal-associated domain-containing protein [Lachnoanaerobaculum umeaense]AYB00541.1 heavy-metal-associated domain-containing protein [Lachnoanaerobaculum umeaense]PZW91517.1 copper chaperone CopZ [Lachnoanaerobaculum umeaense]
MDKVNIIIIVILAAIVFFGLKSYIKKLKKGGDCCPEHEEAIKSVKIKDRDKSHYPYEVKLAIDGMSCGNCVRNVENALNSLDGTWASVSLEDNMATVLLKNPPDIEKLSKAVDDAGYMVLKRKSSY